DFAVGHGLKQLRSRVEGLARAVKDPTMLLGYYVQRVDDLRERLARAATADYARRREWLASMVNHLRLTNPEAEMERCRERLLRLSAKMDTAMFKILDGAREAAAVCSAGLHALSPLAVLARGFSVAVRLPDRTLIKDSGQVGPGDRLEITFRRGAAECVVESARE
ncbi:MAG TPA: exodeoxyribonuclease VII large subunit, partial [Geobacteraceae bacterium]|nr:exodeoxyribonuclease VII large subunit [Geobacteraceae bacterium]